MTTVSRGGAIVLLSIVVACAPAEDQPVSGQPHVPLPEMTDMEPQVRESLEERRTAVQKNPMSAEAWGRFGMVAHAHELWAEAEIAYRQAEKLDRQEKRWPYFLGDVMSVIGTDLKGSENAFRRAIELYPSYAPAHMRLGNTLVANNFPTEAAVEFERALELEPDFDQAKVPLAQIRLSQGDLAAAESLLSEVLEHSPRHGQALSTLAQVLMRQGRREDARTIADRARDPASYNLFKDPLMSEVVAEGVSSIELWERAKSFFESGDYKQAVLGLRRVVELQPDNPTVHQQLGVAYGNIGQLELSRRHLERAVSLETDSVSSRIQLALLLLELGRPSEAIPHLEAARSIADDDPDAGWLLGRARLMSGDAGGAIGAFEQAAATGLEPPAWAENEWGRALIESDRHEEGLARLREVLARDPGNSQALFYVGLVLEGTGRIDEAVVNYCRSQSPPAAARLRVLGRTCS
jgi:Flp pilus assembly protein TadD